MRFFDQTKADFGQSGDLQIYHQFGVSYIDCTNNYPLHLQSNDLRIRKADGGEEMITAVANGTVRLYYNGSQKLTTADNGINVTGTTDTDGLVVSGVTTTSKLLIDSTTPIIDFAESDGNPDYRIYTESGSFVIRDQSNIQERFKITSAGNALFGGAAVSQTNRQLVVGSNAEANLAIETHNTSASETANIRFYRSRGTAASPTTLVDNDVISQLLFYGHDGTDYANAAALIRVECDGTVAGNQMPGCNEFPYKFWNYIYYRKTSHQTIRTSWYRNCFTSGKT